MLRFSLAALTIVCVSSLASAEVIISELMYNPDSSEGRTTEGEPNLVEWVEIYNTGDEAVELGGWHLKDEDGATSQIPAGTKIGPKEAVVIIPADQTVENFRAAWGKGYQVIPLKNWGSEGIHYLSNSPNERNEILMLMKSETMVADTVNYDDDEEAGWPSDDPDGASIYVKPGALTADNNDLGGHWARSTEGKHGAKAVKNIGAYMGQDVGSPGVVATSD